MLNGVDFTDAALLLVAGNKVCPQPQTPEHFFAAVEIIPCGASSFCRIRCRCSQYKNKVPKTTFNFAIGDGGSLLDNHWILDSGSSRHLVDDPSLLIDPIDCQSEFLTAANDGDVLRATKQGSVDIEVVALGVVNTIWLLDD